MRKSFTAVLEQGSTFTANFATEPFESAWASEARWFVRVLELSPDTDLAFTAEISPDGLFWCAEGAAAIHVSEAGLFSVALRDFGHWLRLNCIVGGPQAHAKLLIYLALKE